jgi:GABA permease
MSIEHGLTTARTPAGSPPNPLDVTCELVVANQTVTSRRLHDALHAHAALRPTRFHLVVPATRLHDQDHDLVASENLRAWPGEDLAFALARLRLAHALRRCADHGLRAVGDVGPPDPLAAVLEQLRGADVDRIVVSTLPRASSRWLRSNLVRRLQRETGLPVEHLEARRG